MTPLLIRDGHIIDPTQGLDETGSLLIDKGGIIWLGRGEATPPHTDYGTVSARGLIVCPGFIDLHCHLRQPGFEQKESIATGTKAASRGGFSTVCCMPNTEPPLDSRKTIEQVKDVAEKEGVVRVLPVGCMSRGRQGIELARLSELASAGVVGFSDDGSPMMDTGLMRRAMEYSSILNLPVIDHCEHTELTGDGVMNWSMLSIELGLPGMPSAAEEIMVARDLALAGMTGGWLHVAHVSTAESVELIRRAKARGIRVTAEVTPHHLTLTEEKVRGFNTNAKVNPPLRTEKDRKALVEGLKEGVIDIIATDHAPHTTAEKKKDFIQAPFGISGFETALGSLMKLVHSGELTLSTLLSKLTCEPARLIGDKYGKLGTLAVGAVADVTIFDPDRNWVVDTSKFASKGKNTPLAGSTLKGRVMATIYKGNIVYKDNSVKITSK
ncbi:dihydroorotase [Chloroflexota bacterium]